MNEYLMNFTIVDRKTRFAIDGLARIAPEGERRIRRPSQPRRDAP